jgi:RNA polymerase sigma-70 factor (ECF subfamily)
MVQSDETLMLAVKNGDTEMFSVLFRRHHPRLFAFFYRMTAEASCSEDLAQDVFVRILKYRSGFDEHNNFRAWMYQIARNVRADHFRKSPTESLLQDHSAIAPQPSPSQHFERHEQATMLHKALLALPEEKRELLILARYEEMPYETIAALLELDVGTVKVRVHRAIRELRTLFLKMSGEKTECDVKKSSTILRSI